MEYALNQAESENVAIIWGRVLGVKPIVLSLLFHFFILFTEKLKTIKKHFFYLLIYAPTTFFVILGVFTDVFGAIPIRGYWGWTISEPENPIFLIVLDLWMVTLAVIIMVSIISYYRICQDSIKNTQSLLILYGFIPYLLLFILGDLVLPLFLQFEIPRIQSLGFTTTCVFLGFAIWKYKLITLNLISVSDNIITNLSDSLILVNPEGFITAANPATLNTYQYALEELVNKPVDILLSSKEDTQKYRFQNNLLKNFEKIDVINDIEINFKTKNAKVIPISLSTFKLKNNSGEIQGNVLIGRDITQRKQIDIERKDLLEKQKLYIDEILKTSNIKTDFLSSMSHELRTPLNAIIGFSDLLLECSYGELNSTQRDFLDDINFSSTHLLDMINKILDISKIESGKLKLYYSSFELISMITQIKSSTKPLYEKKELFFEIEGLNNTSQIYADPIRMKEILYNLISNAIKFTLEGGITLKIIEKEKLWEFSISDTGIGIAPEDYELIFKEFKRVQTPFVESVTGTGLGLPLTKRLIILHGGEISFVSELGKGSTFIFTIPKMPMNLM